MKSLFKIPMMAAMVFITFISAKAQDTTAIKQDTAKVDRKNVLNTSVNYVNRLTYLGRVDSLRSSGLFPIVGIESKIGLYANGTFIFTQNSAQPLTYAGTSIEAGYKFPESKHFSGNVFYTRFLYRPTTTIVESALKDQTGINLTWKNKYVNVTGGGDLKFSDKTDIGVTGSVDHLFIFKVTGIKKSAIAVNPTATVNAGSQKFVQTYSKKIGGILGLPGTTQTSENVNQFNILDYEFTMPVVFVVDKFYAAVTPAYVLPQNLVTVNSRPDLSEKGSNLFFCYSHSGHAVGVSINEKTGPGGVVPTHILMILYCDVAIFVVAKM